MNEAFDVFFCHNSTEVKVVRELAAALEGRQLRVCLAERDLIPGRPWQDQIEAAIESAHSVAVLVGRDGQGPWEEMETQAALMLGVKKKKPVIPLLLPGAGEKPSFPSGWHLNGPQWRRERSLGLRVEFAAERPAFSGDRRISTSSEVLLVLLSLSLASRSRPGSSLPS